MQICSQLQYAHLSVCKCAYDIIDKAESVADKEVLVSEFYVEMSGCWIYFCLCFSINRWFKFLRFQVHAKPLSNPDAYSCSSCEIPLSLLILIAWSMAVCDFFWQAPKLKKVEVKKKEVTFLVSINGPFELPKIMVCFLLPSYRKPHHLEPHCMESLPRPCSLEVSAIN